MFRKVVLFVCLSVNTLNSLPQQRRVRLPSSYLAPIAPPQDQEPSPSKTILTSFEPVGLYSGPLPDEEPSASSINSLATYGDEVIAPSEPVSLYSSPSDLARDFDYSEVNFLGDYDIERDVDYAASVVSETVNAKAPVIVSSNSINDYSQPKAEVITSSSISLNEISAPKSQGVVTSRKVINDYSQPKAEVISSSSSNQNNDYGQPRAPVITLTKDSGYGLSSSQDRLASGSSLSSRVVTPSVTSAPVAILRSENSGVNNGRYHYSYEAENGISQDVSGEMKTVNDAQVYVMRGSYSYIGTDGQTYTVDWYADETGYHPSAPHLPRSVEPIYPEVAEAVRAQLEYAALEEAEAAASTNNNVVVSLNDEVNYDDIFSAPDALAGYGQA